MLVPKRFSRRTKKFRGACGKEKLLASLVGQRPAAYLSGLRVCFDQIYPQPSGGTGGTHRHIMESPFIRGTLSKLGAWDLHGDHRYEFSKNGMRSNFFQRIAKVHRSHIRESDDRNHEFRFQPVEDGICQSAA